MRTPVQNGVRLSRSEMFRSKVENCVSDYKKTHRCLNLIRGLRKTSSTLGGKSGDKIVNKTMGATAFNDYSFGNGEKLVFRLLEVNEPLVRQKIPDFRVWLYPSN